MIEVKENSKLFLVYNFSILPKEWKWVRLGEIAKVKGGKRLPKGSQYSEFKTSHPYIRVTDFENYTIRTSKLKYILPETREAIKNYTISKDDLYISIAGSIGIVGIIPDGLDGANLTENSAKITELENVNKKYLVFFLSSHHGQNQIKQLTKTTTQPKLSLYRIEEIKIPITNLEIQKKIVAKIEELFSELDKGKEQLETALQQLKIYRQAVLKWAFEGKLTNKGVKKGELPEGWEWVKLKDISDVNPKIPNKDQILDDLEIQFLPMKLVEEVSGRIQLTETRNYVEVKKGYTPFKEDDVIFAKVTPCMENGKIAVVKNLKNKIGFGSSEFHVLRSKGNVINSYIFYFIVQEKFRKEAENSMTGAVGLRRVPKQFLENYLIPVPQNEEVQYQVIS